MTKPASASSFDEIYALFALIANLESIDESGEPGTLSLAELQGIGTRGLDIMDTTQVSA